MVPDAAEGQATSTMDVIVSMLSALKSFNITAEIRGITISFKRQM